MKIYLLSYVIVIVSGYFVSLGLLNVPFGLSYYVRVEDYVNVSLSLTLGMIVSILGYLIATRLYYKKIVFTDRSFYALVNGMPLYFFYTLLYVFLVYVIFIFSLERQLNYTEGISRVLEFKGSHLLILMLSIYGSLLFVLKGKSFYIYLVILIAAFFALMDGSRVSIIPAAVFLLISIYLKNLRYIALGILLNAILAFLYGIGRDAARQFKWNIDLGVFDYELYLDLFSYIFAFSIYHLADVNLQLKNLHISPSVFLYSITPLPSYFFDNVDLAQIRLDVYRPIGAIGEMYIFGYWTYLLFSFSIGFSLGIFNLRIRGFVKVALYIVVSFLYLMSFQYGLRTIQWFFWPIFIFVFYLQCRAFLIDSHVKSSLN
jgi:hypothetical protein